MGEREREREREEVPFDHSFNRTVSPLSVSPSRFSANMDEDSELAEEALNGEFPELSKKTPSMAQKTKKLAESSKTNKKSLFFKNANFIQYDNQLTYFFYEINPNISILKSTFYSSGNIKILSKTTSDYLLINDYPSATHFTD